MKIYHKKSLLVALFAIFAPFSSAFATTPWPNGLNFELLPLTMSATHVRGLGFGFSLEKNEKEIDCITALQGDLSFPFMQKRNGSNALIGGNGDFNGSLTMLTAAKQNFYVGGKLGVSMLTAGGPIGFFAVSMRLTPKDSDTAGFFSWVTRQIDFGAFANHELYGVVRFGFRLI